MNLQKTLLDKNGSIYSKIFWSMDNSHIIKDYKKYFNKKIIYKTKSQQKGVCRKLSNTNGFL